MHPHALAYTLAVSHRKSIFIFTKTILAFNSIPGVGVQKNCSSSNHHNRCNLFSTESDPKNIYGVVGTNFASAHYCFTGHLPGVKATGLYIGGKGGRSNYSFPTNYPSARLTAVSTQYGGSISGVGERWSFYDFLFPLGFLFTAFHSARTASSTSGGGFCLFVLFNSRLVHSFTFKKSEK